jgi:hypothetical protein
MEPATLRVLRTKIKPKGSIICTETNYSWQFHIRTVAGLLAYSITYKAAFPFPVTGVSSMALQ